MARNAAVDFTPSFVFRIEDLQGLLAPRQGPCVSIYFPSHRRKTEARSDSILYRNLCREVEKILQQEAKTLLATQVKGIQQGGTYSCRRMARFALRSEHSYANAMDIYGFSFTNGKRINVKLHFGKLSEEPDVATSKFLRKVARRAFSEDVFSVVLTPFWDKLHADHLHVDQARYRVNATSLRE